MLFKHTFLILSIIFIWLSMGCKQNSVDSITQKRIVDTKKRAVSYAAEKKYDLATLAIDSALMAEPENIDLYNTKFNILLRWKKYDDGLLVLEKMHQIEVHNAEAYSFQGYINEKLGNDSLALGYYQKAIQACKYRASKKIEEFKNKVNIAFLKHFTENKAASIAYIDSLLIRHSGNGFINDQKELIKDFDKQRFLETL